jgi:arylsulfatase A
MRHCFLCFTIALAVVFAPASAPGAKPNFIVINIDDLGYADIGPYGSDNRTPHLDRMAAEGSVADQPLRRAGLQPVACGAADRLLSETRLADPARAVSGRRRRSASGRSHHRRRVETGGLCDRLHRQMALGGPARVPADSAGIRLLLRHSVLQRHGAGGRRLEEQSGQAVAGPGRGGCQSRCGKTADGRNGLERLRSNAATAAGERNGGVGRVRVEEQFAVTRLYTERAVRFIREHQDQPFFVYLPHTAVHFPLYPSEPFMGKSPNGLIGDWAEEVDWSVGQVLDAVRELKLEANTFVLFTSDNGGALNHGSNNRPLRGSKGSTFEGGIRTCTIAWWPGKIPPGTRTEAITSMMDVLPTLAHLAGAKLPDDRKLDGVNQWPVLAGTADGQPSRDQFFYFRGFKLEAVRSGPWKLHLALGGGSPGQKKTPPRPQLFHLIDDIGETNDVANDHPEVVERLRAMAQAIDGDLGLDGVGPGCRPLGRVAEPLPAIGHDGTVRSDMAGDIKRFP